MHTHAHTHTHTQYCAICASVCQWVSVSVKAHLITGFHCSHSQTAWCLANPHNSAHTGPSLLCHYIISTEAAPSLALCCSLRLALYRRAGSSKGEIQTNEICSRLLFHSRWMQLERLRSHSISRFHFSGMIHGWGRPFIFRHSLRGRRGLLSAHWKRGVKEKTTHHPFMVKSL